MPFNLTLRVQNLFYPLNTYVFLIPAGIGTSLRPGGSTNISATESDVLFIIDFDPFTIPAGVPIQYAIKDYAGSAGESAPTPVFALAPYPKPIITAVSGCRTPASSDPLLTTDCVADVDVLTLTGSGFEPLTSFGVRRTVGNETETLYHQAPARWNAVVYNDTVMVLALTDAVFLFLEEHYAGQRISLSLYWPSNYTSAAFYMTLAPLPAPQVRDYYANEDSRLINNVTVYVGCTPGASSVTLYGAFLINLTVTVGGVEAEQVTSSKAISSTAVFVLPLVLPYNYTALYDIVISSYGGTVVLPGLIQYSSEPFISSVAPCYADIGAVSGIQPPMHCKAGDTLAIIGGLFTQNNRTLSAITFGGFTRSPSPCLSSVIVSDSLITCTLGAYSPPGPLNDYISIAMELNPASYTNRLTVGTLYDQPQAPRVLAIEGCRNTQLSTVTSGLALRGCELGDVITLYGAGFYPAANATWIGVSGLRQSGYTIQPTFFCVSITILSNSTVTCALPTADEWSDMQPLQQYLMILYDPAYPNAYVGASNAFIVSFGTVAEPPSHSSDSAHVALVASLATVLTVLTVLGTATAAYCLLRRRKAGRQQQDERGMAWSQDGVRSTKSDDRVWTAHSGSNKDGVELSRK